MRPRLLLLLCLLLFGLLGAGVALAATIVEKENVRISFSGDFSPHALPRSRPAPVTIHISGRISTTDGTHPPAVRRIEVELNRHGRLSTVGLPVCSGPLLQSTTSEVALQRCRPALVGSGTFGAEVEFGSTEPIPATGKLLAFYGKSGGRSALLLHLYITTPVRTTFVLPLKISHRNKDLFGTVLAANIPTLAGGLGSVTSIDLKIGRSYTYRGQRRSFVSASCPAPAGFTGGPFSLARGNFEFAGGMRLAATLSSACHVR